MIDPITLNEAYRKGKKILDDAGYANGSVDARVLLCHAAGISTESFYAHGDDEFLNNEQMDSYEQMLRLRLARIPVAYITGHKEFMQLDFEVSPAVLIPRPATETLVELTLEKLRSYAINTESPLEREANKSPFEGEANKSPLEGGEGGCSSGSNPHETWETLNTESLKNLAETCCRETDELCEVAEATQQPPEETTGELFVADIGTGSGSIAISLAYYFRKSRIFAIDASCDALRVARKNINRLHKEHPDKNLFFRIHLLHGNLLEPLPVERKERFHVIVSNPPYVTAEEFENLMDGVKMYEPKLALVPDEGAESIYRRLAEDSREFLIPGGCLIVEIGATQGNMVKNVFMEAGYKDIEIHRDLEGFDRVVAGVR